MYHLFDTEMDTISRFNALALAAFSMSSVLLNVILSIIISYGFSSPPVSELGEFLLHKVTLFLSLALLICVVFGVCAVLSRRSTVNKIKRETVSSSQPGPGSSGHK